MSTQNSSRQADTSSDEPPIPPNTANTSNSTTNGDRCVAEIQCVALVPSIPGPIPPRRTLIAQHPGQALNSRAVQQPRASSTLACPYSQSHPSYIPQLPPPPVILPRQKSPSPIPSTSRGAPPTRPETAIPPYPAESHVHLPPILFNVLQWAREYNSQLAADLAGQIAILSNGANNEELNNWIGALVNKLIELHESATEIQAALGKVPSLHPNSELWKKR